MNGLGLFLLLMNVGSGLLLAGLAVPLIRRGIGPNPWYGFRVPATLRDPEVWYEANACAGRVLFRAGIGIALASLALFLWPGIDPESYAWGCLAIAVGGIAASVVASFRHLGRIVGRPGPPRP